jgi:hypothetical protein
MLVGYNTNVPYKGKLYHVQTEDNGIKNPVILTLLYFRGTILAAKKINYAHLAGSPDHKEKIRELMKEQHKTVIKELIRGKYTDDNSSDDAPAPPEKTDGPLMPESSPPGVHHIKSQISGSLDDVLLDFIIEREAEKDAG